MTNKEKLWFFYFLVATYGLIRDGAYYIADGTKKIVDGD